MFTLMRKPGIKPATVFDLAHLKVFKLKVFIEVRIFY